MFSINKPYAGIYKLTCPLLDREYTGYLSKSFDTAKPAGGIIPLNNY